MVASYLSGRGFSYFSARLHAPASGEIKLLEVSSQYSVVSALVIESKRESYFRL